MSAFFDRLINLNSSRVDNNFPKHFENRVYYSSGKTPKNYEGFEYKSNFSLKVMLEGSQQISVNGKVIKLTAGKSVLVNDGATAKFLQEDGKAFSVFLEPDVIVDIVLTLQNEHNRLTSFNDPIENSIEFYSNPVHFIPEQLNVLNCLANRNGPIRLGTGFYYELAIEIIRSHMDLDSIINRAPAKKRSTREELYRRTELARDFLHSTIYEHFSLQETARHSFLSKYHLIRSFKKFYGFTPQQYFIREKIKAVWDCYQRSKGSIQLPQLVLDFGYPDYPTFAKQFKAVMGYSPLKFKGKEPR